MTFWLLTLAWIAVIATFAFTRRLNLTLSARTFGYLLGIPAVALAVGFLADAAEDCPPDAADCDLNALVGPVTGAFVLVVGFSAAIAFESVRAFTRAADRYWGRKANQGR